MSGILGRIDAAVEDWERGPDAMRWSPDPAGDDPTAVAVSVDGWRDVGWLMGHIATLQSFDEINDYLRQALGDLPDRLLWQPVEWEPAPSRADLAPDRVHALGRVPVPAAALAAADCDPLPGHGWFIDRRHEAAEVLGIIAAARKPLQEAS